MCACNLAQGYRGSAVSSNRTFCCHAKEGQWTEGTRDGVTCVAPEIDIIIRWKWFTITDHRWPDPLIAPNLEMFSQIMQRLKPLLTFCGNRLTSFLLLSATSVSNIDEAILSNSARSYYAENICTSRTRRAFLILIYFCIEPISLSPIPLPLIPNTSNTRIRIHFSIVKDVSQTIKKNKKCELSASIGVNSVCSQEAELRFANRRTTFYLYMCSMPIITPCQWFRLKFHFPSMNLFGRSFAVA